jgi:inner membrane protein
MRSNVLLKAVIVGGLALAFVVPLTMIWRVVKDRAQYRDTITAEVAGSTARSQTLVGPLIVVRYRERIPPAVKGGVEQVREGVEIVLPDTLAIRSKAHVETRQRGIYRVPVFRSANEIMAGFTVPARLGVSEKRLLVEEPRGEVVFGVTDPRGIHAAPQVRLGAALLEPRPSAGLGWLPQGFSVPLGSDASGSRVALNITLELMGTDRLMFVPIGSVNDVQLSSDWPHPSFGGAFLPDERSVSAQGFDARWKLSRFATGVNGTLARIQDSMSPGMTTPDRGGTSGFFDSELGVRFVQPVDVYSQSERAVKYGFLFVFLTFVAFFLFEVLRRMAIHPIQYALCGAALALFFLVLVSLSEHLPFAAAYLVASGACVGLLAFYVGHVLHSPWRGILFGGLLGTLYGFLYVILQSEDYALLLGALLLFTALAIVMIMTRRVDWYRLAEEPPAAR